METLKVNVSHLQDNEEISQHVEAYICPDATDSVRSQNLKVEFTISRVQDEIILNGQLYGEVQLTCSRCLAVFSYPVQLQIYRLFPKNNEYIDVNDELKQLLLLHLPDKPLCTEVCKGLCQKCGKDLNTSPCTCSTELHDPRWSKLKDILK